MEKEITLHSGSELRVSSSMHTALRANSTGTYIRPGESQAKDNMLIPCIKTQER